MKSQILFCIVCIVFGEGFPGTHLNKKLRQPLKAIHPVHVMKRNFNRMISKKTDPKKQVPHNHNYTGNNTTNTGKKLTLGTDDRFLPLHNVSRRLQIMSLNNDKPPSRVETPPVEFEIPDITQRLSLLGPGNMSSQNDSFNSNQNISMGKENSTNVLWKTTNLQLSFGNHNFSNSVTKRLLCPLDTISGKYKFLTDEDEEPLPPEWAVSSYDLMEINNVSENLSTSVSSSTAATVTEIPYNLTTTTLHNIQMRNTNQTIKPGIISILIIKFVYFFL